ncbi:melanocortin receptor 4-like [Halyomorpha halys]|uniref:melanocortin receptor 4-like n=1 Tax=Halyomorpha halys TaxID=286706 RepID=UPI0034D21DCF
MEDCPILGNMSNDTDFHHVPRRNYTYIFICSPIITFCVVMVGYNLMILMSLYWIKRPITATLHISLSMAGSDVWTLILDSLGLLFNSLLPIGLGIQKQYLSNCSLLILEGLRMGGKLTTVGHLLFLALNHYCGIKKPLQYHQRYHPICCKYYSICIISIALWIIPSAAIIAYFSLIPDDGLRHKDCTYKFLLRSGFRIGYSLIFFSSIIIMAIIYYHIFRIVRRHQANRDKFRRVGSLYTRNQQSLQGLEQQQQLENRRAIITTLLIVGSMVVGWLPASLSFVLVCECGCVFKNITTTVGAVCNILLILKTAFNSYIYTARMQDIKHALKKMRNSFKNKCCRKNSNEFNGLSEIQSRGFLPRHGENCTQL